MVSGNFFIQSSALNRYNYVPIAISTSLGTLSPAPTGLSVYGSRNTIFGNAFAVDLTVIRQTCWLITSGYDFHSDKLQGFGALVQDFIR